MTDELDMQLEERAMQEEPRIALFPDLFVSGLTGIVILLCIYSVLCIFVPASLGVRADTDVVPPGAGPSWFLVFLKPYLSEVPRWLGSLTPVLLLVLLGAFPFLDRNPSREPSKRILALTLGGLGLAAILALSFLGQAS